MNPESPDYLTPSPCVKAPIDGSAITSAAFVPAGRPYQVCTRCVMDTTDPLIKFDDNGRCNHCRDFDGLHGTVWFPDANFFWSVRPDPARP